MRDRTETQIILALIRHGETEANRERRYLGKTDEALSKQGKELLLSRRKHKAYPAVTYLFCSPMKRCRQTAGILYPERKQVIVPEWEETDFGEFEYKNYEELKENERYQAWIDSGGTLAFPGGESREAFVMRCERGFHHMLDMLSRMMEKDAKDSISLGAVVHGGTIMALLSLYGGASYFAYQAACGGGYLCRLQSWHPDVAGKRRKIKIEVVKKI